MTYKIKLTSQAHVIALLIILLSGFFLSYYLIPRPIAKQFSLLITIGYFVLSVILWRKSVIGVSLWTITENGVTMEWLKRFPFDTNSKGFYLQWDEIRTFRIKRDGYYKRITF